MRTSNTQYNLVSLSMGGCGVTYLKSCFFGEVAAAGEREEEKEREHAKNMSYGHEGEGQRRRGRSQVGRRKGFSLATGEVMNERWP